MKKSAKNFLKSFVIVMILAICLNSNSCISFKSMDLSLAKVINPGPEITMNPIAWIRDGRIEDRDGNEIYITDGYVVNENFWIWVWDMKRELKKCLKGN